MNVEVRALGDAEGCEVTTETRIYLTDRSAWVKFALYWALIRLGSGLIRLAC